MFKSVETGNMESNTSNH